MFSSKGISRRLRVGLMTIAVAGSGMLVTTSPASAHGRAPVCWCVDYVKHSYGISGPTGHAKDMGSSLVTTYGFRKLTTPVAGAIVVFQPSYVNVDRNGNVIGRVDRTYGHVGRILGVSDGGSWKLTVRSANYGGTNNVLDCTNVNDKPFFARKGSGSVAYYKR
jgi:surface antigen